MEDEVFLKYLYDLYVKDVKAETDDNSILVGYLSYRGFKQHIKNSLNINNE